MRVYFWIMVLGVGVHCGIEAWLQVLEIAAGAKS